VSDQNSVFREPDYASRIQPSKPGTFAYYRRDPRADLSDRSVIEVMIPQDEVDRAGHCRFHQQKGIRYGRCLGYVSGNQDAICAFSAELIQEPPYLAAVEEFQVDVIEPDSSHFLSFFAGSYLYVGPMTRNDLLP
jgi:hypothetical protein